MAMTRIKRELLQLALAGSSGGGGGSTQIIPDEYTQYESTYKLTIGTNDLPSSGIYVFDVNVDADTARKFNVGDKVCIKAPYATSSSASSILGYAYVWGTVTLKNSGPVYADVTLNPVDGFILNPTDSIPSASNITANGYKNYMFGFGGVRVDVPSTIKVYQNLTFAGLPVAGQQFVQVLDTNVNRLDAVGLIGSYNGNDYAVYGVVTAKNNATAYINVSNVIQLQSGGSSPAPSEYTLKESSRKIPMNTVAQIQVGQRLGIQVDTATAETISVNDTVCVKSQYADTVTSAQSYGDIYIWGSIVSKSGSSSVYRNITMDVVGVSLQPTSMPSRDVYANGIDYTFGYGSVNVDVSMPITATGVSFYSDPTDSSGEVTFLYYPQNTPTLYNDCYLVGDYNGVAYAVYGQLQSYDENTHEAVSTCINVVGGSGGGGVPAKSSLTVPVFAFYAVPSLSCVSFRTEDMQQNVDIDDAISAAANCNGLWVHGEYTYGSESENGTYFAHFMPESLPEFNRISQVYIGTPDAVYKGSTM